LHLGSRGKGIADQRYLHFEVVLFTLPPIFAAAMGMASAAARF
jgi:hypothetical protein